MMGVPRDRKIGRAALLCAALSVGQVAQVSAEPGQPRFTAWQEIVLLTVTKVRHAAATCGYTVNTGQVDALLASAALDEAAVDPQAFPPSLARQVAADADMYLDAKEAACAGAWGRYGPDGAPGIRDALRP